MSICRIESKKSNGLQVRVFSGGYVFTKFLAYKKFGGKKKAFALAIEWEKILKKLHPEMPSRKKKFHTNRPNRNNTSGIAGIQAFIKKGRKRQPVLQFATSYSGGRIQRSSGEHGILGALNQVLEARQNATGFAMPSARKAWEIIKRHKGW